MYTTLNEAYTAALAIALDRFKDNHPNDILVSMDAGDGAGLYARTKDGRDNITVNIGGAATDLDEPFYTIHSVEYFAIGD